MSKPIIQKVSARALSEQIRADRSDVSSSKIFAPLSADQLAETVREIGFKPSALYVELMQEVGNGGFGPGYGLMGLVGGATNDRGDTAVDLYKVFAQPDPNEPSWKWPQGLLPICHWGCAIYSCIDCTNEEAMVMTWDPNEWEDGTSPTLAICSTEMTLAEWLLAWSDGVNLWEKRSPSS